MSVVAGHDESFDLAAARSGDDGAFERIYLRHSGRVHRLTRWLIGPDDAEEVLQEVFVRVWHGLPGYRGEAAPGTWIHRIAINVILQWRRRRARQRRHPVLTPEALPARIDLRARPVTPELAMTLAAAIETLAPELRDVFVLHDVEGYLHEEIGRLLGIPKGTSASRLHRARLELRKVLT